MTDARRARLLADESLGGPIVRGLRHRHPDVELLVSREEGLESWPDPEVLAWAADRGLVVVAQDVSTMTGDANDRMMRGLAFPGLILVPEKLRVGIVIRDIAALVEKSPTEPLDGRLVFLPLDKSWRVGEPDPDEIVATA